MFKCRIPLWAALSGCLFTAGVGVLWAQDAKEKDEVKPPPVEYTYLPDLGLPFNYYACHRFDTNVF